MRYGIKLTPEAIDTIQKILGVDNGILNLTKGTLIVNEITPELLQAINDKYGIQNINWVPYKPNASLDIYEKMTLEERKKIIGTELEIGSIVRVRSGNEKLLHIVISSVQGEQFEGFIIYLTDVGYDPATEVILTKGIDVVYRNLTYKNQVRMTRQIVSGLKKEDFLSGSGGLIVGKVVNEDLLRNFLGLDAFSEKDEGGDDAALGSSFDNGNQEKSPVGELCDFESIVENAESVDTLLEKLHLTSNILKEAVYDCVATRRYAMKKLLPAMQAIHNSGGQNLTQNAIKSLMSQELADWCEAENVLMDEYTLSYFLKTIVKRRIS